MKKIKELIKKSIESFNSKTVKAGSYSLSASLIVLAILVVVNVMFSSLSSKYTQIDMSSAKLYSLTTQSKAVVSSIEEDVTIYWVVQSGEEDDVLEKLLEKYDDLSDYVEIVKKDPDAYPTFMKQYTSSTYDNNCLVVEGNDKYRYISYDEIYQTTSSYYSTSSSFDGEGCITSAIDYVVSDDFPLIYITKGHGELELSDSMVEAIEKDNIEIETGSLLTLSEISQDIDCVVMNGPESDISIEEKEMIETYLENGGNIVVLAGPSESSELANLESILSTYGVESVEGLVLESNQYYYAYGYSFVLLPDLENHDITNPLSESNYYAILPISKGYTIENIDDESIEVISLLTTSSSAYSKIDGYNITSYDYEENDIEGPFSLGVAIAKSLEDDESHIVWFGSSYMIEDTYDSYSSGANSDLFMNALTWAIGEEETINIRSKSLDYEYLVIDSSTSSTIQMMVIAVIPLSYLGIGLFITIKRRTKS